MYLHYNFIQDAHLAIPSEWVIELDATQRKFIWISSHKSQMKYPKDGKTVDKILSSPYLSSSPLLSSFLLFSPLPPPPPPSLLFSPLFSCCPPFYPLLFFCFLFCFLNKLSLHVSFHTLTSSNIVFMLLLNKDLFCVRGFCLNTKGGGRWPWAHHWASSAFQVLHEVEETSMDPGFVASHCFP